MAERMSRAGVLDVVMMRRAAEACRNARKQMKGRTDWFEWVPEYLDRLVEHEEAADAE